MRQIILLGCLTMSVAAQTPDYGRVARSGAVYDLGNAARTRVVQTGLLSQMPASCIEGQLYFATDGKPGRRIRECSAADKWEVAAYEQGTGLPASCSVGALFFKTDDVAGRNLYFCTGADQWTQMAGSGDTTVASNAGTGAALLKVGSNVEAKTLVAGANVTITSGTDTVTIASTGGTGSNMRTAPFWFDDFNMGAYSSNNIGSFRWTLTNGTGASGSFVTAASGRPGQIQVGSGTTSTVLNYPAGAASLLHTADYFDLRIIAKLDHNDANTIWRAGLNCTGSYGPANPNIGIYIEKEDADTSFYGVTFNGVGNETRTQLGATDTSYHTFRIRRVNSSTIGYTLDAGVEQTTTLNVPSAGCNLILSIGNSAGSGTKQFTIDYAELTISGLGR